jgi:hypothetical protein
MFVRSGIVAIMIGAGVAQAGVTSVLLDDYDLVLNNDLLGVASYTGLVFNNPYDQGYDFSLETTLDTGDDIGGIVFNSGIGVEQSLFVEYNNLGAGLDLSASNLSLEAFEITFAEVDQDFIASIRLSTFDSNGQIVGSAIWGAQVNAGIDVAATWNLSGIISTTGDFDLENIDEVEVNFNISNNTTASLDFIATEFRAIVPSPGSSVLLGLGGAMVARRHRN